MANPIVGFIVRIALEGPARRLGDDRLREQLERSGASLHRRFEAAADTPKARKLLRHIVGIERWGQRRLRVALAELPFEADGHHTYLPDAEAALPQLCAELQATRAETVSLARRVAEAGVAETRVAHNAMGPLSAAAWLRYLRLHGDLESRRLRR